MRGERSVLFLILTMAAVFGVSPVKAQVDTATIVGTVQDASGGLVTGATITATDMGTGIEVSTHTDSAGTYVITPLKVGRYIVTAEAKGFKKESNVGIVLQVQDRLRVDVTLQVGSVTETINIQAEPTLVQTESSALGDVVDSRKITALPLNGRDYTQLATLTTGVVKITENGGGINGATSASNGNAGGAFAVNGSRGNLNNFMLDGIDNNSNDNAGNIFRTNVDAIEEFKIQTSNYSSEFGRSGGAVINATIKSGTNAFHGTLFEFLRNSAMDARGFFEPPDQPKAPFKQNQFGGTLGGPIKRNKLFFFVDYQGTRVRAATTSILIVPTPAEIGGDFSGVLGDQVGTDALGRPVFENEIFDPKSTRQVGDAVVRNAFGFDPISGLPIPGQANIIPASRFDTIAHNVANLYPAPTDPTSFANNYVVNAPGQDNIDQMDARGDYSITSRQQLFGRFSLSERTRFQAPPFPGLADGGSYGTGNYLEDTHGAALGYTFTISPSMVNEFRAGFNRNHYDDNIPAYGQNYPPEGLAVPGVPNDPRINGVTLFQPSGYRRVGEPGYTPTISTSQEIQFGDTLSLVRGKHTIKLGPQTRFSQFNLFQVGQPRGRFSFSGEFTASSPSAGDGSGNGLADMLLGLPSTSVISTLTAFENRQNTYGGFVQDDFKVSSTLTLNLGLRYDYTTPIFEAHDRQSNFNFATGQIIIANQNGTSRGLVTTDKDDFAPRLGLAWSPFKNNKTVIRAGYGRFFSYQEIRTGDPLQLAYNLPFFFEPSFVSDGITPILTVSGGFPPLDVNDAKFAGVTSNDSRLHAPVTDEWNFNVQQELPANILFEVAYVGAKGTHLQVLVDHNQDPIPGPGDVQSRRPYPQYGPFTSIENHGNSTYHALQLKAEKRLSAGLLFLSAFTYGKSINDQPEICCSGPWPQNSYNLRAEKGPSDFDNRFRWVSSFDYELPIGKGKRYVNSSRVGDLILGGWHVGGIITLRTGFPFSPLMDYDPSNTGSNGFLRTDRTADGNLPKDKRSPDLWFDVNAFPLPTGYTFGNAGKNILNGPGGVTADMSARKIFSLTERWNLEFRAEFFNMFNHPVFAQPDNFITDGPGAAGVITSTVIPQRQIQFSLKLLF
ncbi:MAG: TonB-dependent receptor domain-containing protein [Bryobacteraceae bacterium]